MREPVVLLILLFGSFSAGAGEIFCEQETRAVWDRVSEDNRTSLEGHECIVAQFAGDIQEGDFQKVNGFLESNTVLYLLLDSNGGTLSEALRIGRLINDYKLLTIVENNKGNVCNSACFFIWAGGSYRAGNPAIHRPYLPNRGLAQTTLDAASQLYSEMTKEIERFLSELELDRHLPPDFVSTMMSTPPQDAFLLSRFERRSPGLLNKYDPGVEQYMLDKCGSLDNDDCELNALLSNAIVRTNPRPQH